MANIQNNEKDEDILSDVVVLTQLNPEKICEPNYNPEQICQPDYKPENFCEPDHNPENICEPDHNLENIFEPDNNPENMFEPDHNIENICEPDHKLENICEPDHNQEEICEPKDNPEDVDQNCSKSHHKEKFENSEPEPGPCQRTAPVHFVKLKFISDTRIPKIIIRGSSSLKSKKIISKVKPCSDQKDCKTVKALSDQHPEPSPPLSSSQDQSKPNLVKINSESRLQKPQVQSQAKNTEHFLNPSLDIKHKLDSFPEKEPALNQNQAPVNTKYPKKALIVKFFQDHKIVRIINISGAFRIKKGMSSINSTSSSSTTGTSYSKGSINSRSSSSTSGTSYSSGSINSRSSSSTTKSSSTSSTASSRSFSCNDIIPGNSFNRIFPNSTADSRITGSHQTMTVVVVDGPITDLGIIPEFLKDERNFLAKQQARWMWVKKKNDDSDLESDFKKEMKQKEEESTDDTNEEKDWIEGKRSGVDGKIRKLDGSGQKRKRIVSEREEETLNLLKPKKRLRVENGEEKKDLDVLKPNMEIKDVKENEGGELDELDEEVERKDPNIQKIKIEVNIRNMSRKTNVSDSKLMKNQYESDKPQESKSTFEEFLETIDVNKYKKSSNIQSNQTKGTKEKEVKMTEETEQKQKKTIKKGLNQIKNEGKKSNTDKKIESIRNQKTEDQRSTKIEEKLKKSKNSYGKNPHSPKIKKCRVNVRNVCKKKGYSKLNSRVEKYLKTNIMDSLYLGRSKPQPVKNAVYKSGNESNKEKKIKRGLQTENEQEKSREVTQTMTEDEQQKSVELRQKTENEQEKSQVVTHTMTKDEQQKSVELRHKTQNEQEKSVEAKSKEIEIKPEISVQREVKKTSDHKDNSSKDRLNKIAEDCKRSEDLKNKSIDNNQKEDKGKSIITERPEQDLLKIKDCSGECLRYPKLRKCKVNLKNICNKKGYSKLKSRVEKYRKINRMDSIHLGSSKPVTGLNPVYEPDNGDFKKMLEKIMKMDKTGKVKKRKSSKKEGKRDVLNKKDSHKKKVHDKINDIVTDESNEKVLFNKKDVLEKDVHNTEKGEEKKDVNTNKILNEKDLIGSKEIVEFKKVNNQRKAQNEEMEVLDHQVINSEKECNADTNVIREVTNNKSVIDLNTDYSSLLIALPLVTDDSSHQDDVKLTKDSQPIHKPSPVKKRSSLDLFQFSIKTDASFLQYSGQPMKEDILVKNTKAREKMKSEKKNGIHVCNPEMKGCPGKVENYREDIHPDLEIVMVKQPKTAERFSMNPKPKNGEIFEMEAQPINEERYKIEKQLKNVERIQMDSEPKNKERYETETQPMNVERIQMDAEPKNKERYEIETQPKNVERIQMDAEPKNVERSEMEAQPKNEEMPQKPLELAVRKDRHEPSKNPKIKNNGKCMSIFKGLIKSNKDKKRIRSPEKYPNLADLGKFKVPKLLKKIDPRLAKSSLHGSIVSGSSGSLTLSGSNKDSLGSKVSATNGFGAFSTKGSSSKGPAKPSATVVYGSASATVVSASSLDPSSRAHLFQSNLPISAEALNYCRRKGISTKSSSSEQLNMICSKPETQSTLEDLPMKTYRVEDEIELGDLKDPGWNIFRSKKTDNDRLKVTQDIFRLPSPANPLQNLTYYGYRRRKSEDPETRRRNDRKILPRNGFELVNGRVVPRPGYGLMRDGSLVENPVVEIDEKDSKIIPFSEFRSIMLTRYLENYCKSRKYIKATPAEERNAVRNLDLFIKHFEQAILELEDFLSFYQKKDKVGFSQRMVEDILNSENQFLAFPTYYGPKLTLNCKPCKTSHWFSI